MDDEIRLDYLEWLFPLRGSFENEILKCVPEGITLKARDPVREVCPGDDGYEYYREQLNEGVGSAESIQILLSLYRYHTYHRKHIERLLELLPLGRLTQGRLERIRHDFPRIDQTTVVAINPNLKKSYVVYRLEDLERIGLVARSELGPPDRKHVQITEKGIAFVRRVIDAGRAQLKKHFRDSPDPKDGEG